MNYSLLVLSPPFNGDTALTAQRFARAVLARGHSIERVFFYADGVLNGTGSSVFAQDETDPTTGWVELAKEHQVELILCVSSALKRGMLDAVEAQRHEIGERTIHPAFEISGLGQLVDSAAKSDRIITFGG